MITQAQIPERVFTVQVIEYANITGWRVCHFHDSRRQVTRRGKTFFVGDASAAGFPDLTIVRSPRVVFAELKAANGRVRAAQQGWLEELGGCPGVETYLWKPEDWDEIQRILR